MASVSDLYAKVLLDVPNLPPLDYKVPQEFDVVVGDRVEVQLGARKCIGLVCAISNASDVDKKKLRSIRKVMKLLPPMRAEWMALTRFAAAYYLRSWGEAAVSAIPAYFRRPEGKQFKTRLEKMRSSLIVDPSNDVTGRHELRPEQKSAVEKLSAVSGFAVNVLYGVTGSGKTEVYMRTIDEVLRRDPEAQVLLLVPEINLTPQLERRVRQSFPGELVVSTNSNLSQGERARSWLAAHEGKARVLVGTRLAVFSSFKKLSLIIVDEEHDLSYKANDGLKFSARDLAVWRAKSNNCPIVLGSATPSIETWQNVRNGRYGLIEMKKRAVENSELPEILLSAQPKPYEGEISETAVKMAEDVLGEGRQVLFFMNRRGYAPTLTCPSCGWISRCVNCSTNMVYHKAENCLICHHCGDRKPIPEECPSCSSVDLRPNGSGTQKIEEEIERVFCGRRILRIDADSTSSKTKSRELFQKINSTEVDVFVGTQMIAKGHDFKNVGLVVVLNTDVQLMSPLTRAKERLFSTLVQVSGRAGRSGRRGKVLIQTDYPTELMFDALKNHDYEMYADALLDERRRNFSAPFVHQALLTAASDEVSFALEFLEEAARFGLNNAPETVRVFDPVPMAVLKVMGEERAQLLIEGDDRKDLHDFLRSLLRSLNAPSSVRWSIEVDPMEV